MPFFKSILKPPESVAVSMSAAGLAASIYSFSLPNGGTMQATDPYDKNLEANRKKAAWLSVAAISAMTLLTRDVNVFVIGGATIIALDWHARHAISVHPATGQVVTYSRDPAPLTVAG